MFSRPGRSGSLGSAGGVGEGDGDAPVDRAAAAPAAAAEDGRCAGGVDDVDGAAGAHGVDVDQLLDEGGDRGSGCTSFVSHVAAPVSEGQRVAGTRDRSLGQRNIQGGERDETRRVSSEVSDLSDWLSDRAGTIHPCVTAGMRPGFQSNVL